MRTTTKRRTTPTCVAISTTQTLPCPDCGGETFLDEDRNGPLLVCLDCVAFAPTFATDE